MLTEDLTPNAALRHDGERPRPDTRPRGRKHALLAAALCAACFLWVAPFLPLFEFSNGGENLVVASVQEIRRGGPWLVPTLHEEQRTKKPPLATWLSALATTPQIVARQSDADPAVRSEAFRTFAWQVRWPALLAMCGVVAATYALGAAVGGPRLGLVSALVCASSFFWIRNARMATTDAHLALWVSVANCLLAATVLGGRRWLGLVGAGAALGLAMMSKGPVAMLQTVVPVLAFVAWRRWWWERLALPVARVHPEESDDWTVSYALAPPGVAKRPSKSLRSSEWLLPLLGALLAFAVLGFTWYLLVWWKNPAVVDEWLREVTREGATGLPPSKWYAYAGLVHSLFPWCFFFLAGLIGSATIAVRRARDVPEGEERDRIGRVVLPLLMLLVPILVMSFFRDREIRYLIPLLGPASVITAFAIFQLLALRVRRRFTTAMVVGFHWLPLLVISVALPLVASPIGAVEAIGGQPWYSLRFAVIAAEVFLVLVVAAAVLQRRWPMGAVAGGTVLVMAIWGTVLNAGYRHSREGRSEMRPLAEKILASHPDATVYSLRPDRPIRKAPIDLSIYLNRVVENLGDLGELESTSGPRVLLIRQKAGQPAPAAPAGWRPFAQTPNDDSIWYSYTPPSASPETKPSPAPQRPPG